MSTGKFEYFPPEASAEREAREEHRARVWQKQPLARAILLPEKVPYIAVNSGRCHSGMGTRDRISENVDPTADIALLCPESLIIDGLTGERIGAFVSIGSPLSNMSARLLDGHAETLERVRRPLLETSLITEFDSNTSVVSYIEGAKVLEPDRRVVDTRDKEIFHPHLIDHVPAHDALVLKVLRGRGGAPGFLRLEGWGPAGTVRGFRMLLEDYPTLVELSKFASKWESFEAVIVVEGVRAETDWRGHKRMVARGPLHIMKCEPIRQLEESVGVIRAAFEASARLISRQGPTVVNFRSVRDQPFALNRRNDYNARDKYAAVPVVSPINDHMKNEETGRQIIKMLMSEFRKARHDLVAKSARPGISDEQTIDIFRQSVALGREFFEARLVNGMTSGEFHVRKLQEAVERESVVFESRPKQKQPLTPPDLSDIPLWQGRRKDGMPLEFVEKHYGKWLSSFGAEEDSVFQDQIRAHDPGLIKGVHNQFREEKKDRSLHDFVKPRGARTERELKQFDLDTLKRARRAHDLLRRRQGLGSPRPKQRR